MKKPALIFLVILPSITVVACLVAGGLLAYRLMPTEVMTLDEYLRRHGDVELGTVTVSDEVVEISLGEGKTVVTIPVDGGRAEAPEGTWDIHYWKSSRTAEDGAAWEAICGYYRGQGTLEVTAGGEVALETGGPLKAVLAVSRTDKQYRFTQRLEGPRGEDVTLLKNGRAAPAPRLRIWNADGSYDREFQFAYG